MYVTCNYGHQVWVEKVPANGLCRCPHCESLFAPLLPESDGKEPAAPRRTPTLTHQHRCQQCHKEIDVPADLRLGMVACPYGDHGTSVYALVYHCLECGKLLATPAAKEGGTTRCPGCGCEIEVPRDELFRQRGEPLDDRWFTFECVHCSAWLEALRAKVGQLGVCPHCLRPVRVPKWGYLAGEAPATMTDPLATLSDGTTRHCPHCGQPRPTRATICPSCGEEDP
jgi:hypothetical protein